MRRHIALVAALLWSAAPANGAEAQPRPQPASEDLFLIFRARYVDMDTGSTIDRQMLTMGRPHADMLAFLDAPEPSDSSRKLREELAQYYDRPSFESDAEYIEGMERYFAAWRQSDKR